LTIETYSEIDLLAGEWDELADRLRVSPFLRPGWFTAWRRAFGTGRLEIIAARRGGRLAAVAALERTRLVLRSPTNWHTPLWAPLAEDADALRVILEQMVARAKPWLSLGFVGLGSDELEASRQAARSCRTRIYTLERSPYVLLEGTWEEYARRLTAKRRSNLRRLERRLQEHGHLAFEVHDGRRELSALLEEGFRVEASGWKGERGTAISSTPQTRRFYEDAAAWAARRGSLRLGFLRLDGRPLAFDFAIEEVGAHSLLKTGFDEAWRAYAPGVLLRQRMIERAFVLGLDTYEFLGDATDWKLEWIDSTHERVAVEAFRRSPAGTVGWVTWAYARPAVRHLEAILRGRGQPRKRRADASADGS
jgi:CelD/BcsL family acetyltransferase involved in cellulose biosynthesis